MEIKLNFAIAPMTKQRVIEIAERNAKLKADRLENKNAEPAKPVPNYKPESAKLNITTKPSLPPIERKIKIAENNVRLNVSEINEVKKEYNPIKLNSLQNKLLNNLEKATELKEQTKVEPKPVKLKFEFKLPVKKEISEPKPSEPSEQLAVKPETIIKPKFNFVMPQKLNSAMPSNTATENAEPKTNGVANIATTIRIVQTIKASETVTAKPTSTPTQVNSSTFQWDESQLKAIDNILTHNYNCLIGAAGSGKTTVVKEVISRLKSNGFIKPLEYQRCNGMLFQGYNIAFVSFTGKAVEQLRKSVPPELQAGCMTIHNLLEYAPVAEEYVDDQGRLKTKKIFLPRRDVVNQLPHDIIVIDESGMVGVELWNNLYNALVKKPELKIILIGDINQLPAVIGKSVLGYALASSLWTTSTLTKIHRQALDNPIIANAHRIIAGKMPVADSDKNNFKLVDIGSLTSAEREKVKSRQLPFEYYDKKNNEFNGYKTVLNVVSLLYKNGKYDPDVDQIIVPQNTGMLGQESLNRKLAELFNPTPRTFIRAGIETKLLAVGDKVMFTANDYGSGILNGMTGYIKEIDLNAEYTGFAEINQESLNSDKDNSERIADIQAHAAAIDINELIAETSLDGDNQEKEQQASHVVTVAYTPLGSDKESTIKLSSVGSLRGLYLAYAITCHKAQGSEYRNVIVVAHSASSSLLSREWLYTAVTRAKETLYLIYNDWSAKGISKALRRQVIEGNSIEEKAKNFSLAEAQSKAIKSANENQLVPQGV